MYMYILRHNLVYTCRSNVACTAHSSQQYSAQYSMLDNDVPLTKYTVYTMSHIYMYMSSGKVISRMYEMMSGHK